MEDLQVRHGEVAQYSAKDVMSQVKAIQELMKEAMKDGEHYGKIPGCGDKPALLKPGSEKITFMFRLASHYEVTEKELPNGHREYRILTELVHIPTGKSWGEGVGSASTMESKWRFRNASRKCPECGVEAIIKGKVEYGGGWICFAKKGGCGAKFTDEDETITTQETGKVEYDNPADNYNTVLKMAKKRSLVDATLTATAASDIFTQDVEELVDNGVIAPPNEHHQVVPVEKHTIPPPATETSIDDLKEELKKGNKWNGKRYKNGVIYLNDNRYLISDKTLTELENLMGVV